MAGRTNPCGHAHGARTASRAAFFALVLLGIALPPPAATAQAAPPDLFDVVDLKKLEQSFVKLADEVRPVVVAIETRRTVDRDANRSVPNSHGSGVIIRSDGRILTNHHVIEDADIIRVTLWHGTRYDARLVQYDPRSDLAVIKIDANDLKVAQFGDIAEVRQGQWAFTVGNPFGLANARGNTSIASGIIEAFGRSLSDLIDSPGNDRFYGDLIQTTASINPGNSGGPLFDLDGRVIGINTAMVSSSGVNEGLGFAIPISTPTRRVIDLLADGEIVRYGFLGVRVQDAKPADARAQGISSGRGAEVFALTGDPEQSPAARAGLQPRDIITEFDGTPVGTRDELVALVGATPVGREVEVTFYRAGERKVSRVKLAERAETATARNRTNESRADVRTMTWRGLSLVEPTDGFLSSRGLSRQDAGLYVFEVPPDSPFRRAGLREETLIVRLDGRRVRTFSELLEAEKAMRGDIRLELADGTVVIVPR